MSSANILISSSNREKTKKKKQVTLSFIFYFHYLFLITFFPLSTIVRKKILLFLNQFNWKRYSRLEIHIFLKDSVYIKRQLVEKPPMATEHDSQETSWCILKRITQVKKKCFDFILPSRPSNKDAAEAFWNFTNISIVPRRINNTLKEDIFLQLIKRSSSGEVAT